MTFFVSGNIILHSKMAVEIVGRWQNPRPDDGPGRGSLHRNREKAEEETDDRLFVGKFEVSQLVGLQIFPV